MYRLQNTICICALQAKGAPELSKTHMTPLMLRFQGKGAVTVAISACLSWKAELERPHHTRKIRNQHHGKHFTVNYLGIKTSVFQGALKKCHWHVL